MSDTPPPTTDRPDDTLVGTVLAGRYRIVRKLGSGAMGAVYLGEHLRFGRLDAIKILREEMARDREATDRFLRGARNVSAIKHPNVCTVYDFGDTEDGRQFLAMEYVEGETLADTLERETRLELDRAVEIVTQIARALDAAHHVGIVHRDLKPGNVMITRALDGGDLVKVVDFDIAKGTADGEGAEVTRTGFVVGTPEYMSPEQLTADPLDGRSDIYSLAVVFVRILTGALPVRAESTQDLMVERLTRDAVPLAELAPDLELPSGLQAAVTRGLQRRRDDRPASAGAFVRGLRTVLDSGGRSAAAPVGREPPGGTVAGSAGGRDRVGGGAAGGTRTGGGTAPVPPTRVGSTPPPDEGRTSGPRRPSPGRGPWIAGGAVAVAAVAVGLFALSGGEGTEGGEGGEVTAAVDEDGGVATPGSDPPPGETSPSDPPIDTPGEGGAIGDERDGDPGVGEEPGTTPSDPVEATVLSDTEVEDLLFRQLTVLSDADTPDAWRTARDSAEWAWNQSAYPPPVRALAAYVSASALQAAGRGDEALPWARRAVDLAPSNRGFRTLLEQLGGAP